MKKNILFLGIIYGMALGFLGQANAMDKALWESRATGSNSEEKKSDDSEEETRYVEPNRIKGKPRRRKMVGDEKAEKTKKLSIVFPVPISESPSPVYVNPHFGDNEYIELAPKAAKCERVYAVPSSNLERWSSAARSSSSSSSPTLSFTPSPPPIPPYDGKLLKIVRSSKDLSLSGDFASGNAKKDSVSKACLKLQIEIRELKSSMDKALKKIEEKKKKIKALRPDNDDLLDGVDISDFDQSETPTAVSSQVNEPKAFDSPRTHTANQLGAFHLGGKLIDDDLETDWCKELVEGKLTAVKQRLTDRLKDLQKEKKALDDSIRKLQRAEKK